MVRTADSTIECNASLAPTSSDSVAGGRLRCHHRSTARQDLPHRPGDRLVLRQGMLARSRADGLRRLYLQRHRSCSPSPRPVRRRADERQRRLSSILVDRFRDSCIPLTPSLYSRLAQTRPKNPARATNQRAKPGVWLKAHRGRNESVRLTEAEKFQRRALTIRQMQVRFASPIGSTERGDV